MAIYKTYKARFMHCMHMLMLESYDLIVLKEEAFKRHLLIVKVTTCCSTPSIFTGVRLTASGSQSDTHAPFSNMYG